MNTLTTSSPKRSPLGQNSSSKTNDILEDGRQEVGIEHLEARVHKLPQTSASNNNNDSPSPTASTSSAFVVGEDGIIPDAGGKVAPIQPDLSVLRDMELHARSISSNIDMALRDLRGSLRGMSDLTLESVQVFSSSINSSCDSVDAAIKYTYSVLAKAEELNSSMRGVRKLAEQVKDMKRVVDLFEMHLLPEDLSNKVHSTTNELF